MNELAAHAVVTAERSIVVQVAGSGNTPASLTCA